MPNEVAHGMGNACGDDEVFRLGLLQHLPHGPGIVPRKSPVSPRLKISQAQLLLHSKLDPGHGIGHLAGNEFAAAPGSLVVKENSATAKHAVTLAVVHRDPVPVDLGHAIRTPRVEGRGFPLRRFLDLAEHLTRGSLIKADAPRVQVPDSFQHARDAHCREFSGQDRLLPARRHEAHGGEVIDLIGFGRLYHVNDGELVQ
jgi:hypothetical protein